MAVEHRRAVFLDKDGTLVKDIPYNIDVEKLALEPGVADGLRRLSQAGYWLVIVSNQSGLARGLFTEAQLMAVIQKMGFLFQAEAGASLSGFYYCPHHPDGSVAQYAHECTCRKPDPGLLFQAAQELELSLDDSWMIGDILNDIEAGKRAGCRAILIANGNETEWKTGALRQPDFIVADFKDAADAILRCSEQYADQPYLQETE
jgi:D-glycero-D-manno-heptose 1,7-bisphosphate phosphatase